MIKKILSIILVVLLIGSVFTACGNNENNNGQEQNNASNNNEATNNSNNNENTEENNNNSNNNNNNADANDNDEEQNSEPTKLSFFMQGVAEMDPEGERFEAIEALTNVEVDWIIPPRESFGEQLSLTLAAKELPDLIESISVSQWREGAEKGAFLDLTPYQDNMTNILEWSYEECIKQAYVGDKMYAIPRGTLVRGDPYIVRKDWVEELDLDIPVTLDDYYDFMKAIAHDDPDGNGKDDTYAFSDMTSEGGLFLSPYSQFIGIHNAHGVGFGWIEDENGELYNSFFVPEMKESLNYVKRLMDEKIIDPNIIVNQQYAENFYNGVSGMMRAYAGSYTTAKNLVQQKNPDGDVMFIDVPAGEDGVVRRHAGSKGSNNWIVVSKDSENPEAAISFIDSLLSDEGWDIICYGLEDIDYTVENGEKVFTEEYSTYSTWRKWLGVVRRPQSIPYYLDSNMNKEDLEYSVGWLERSQEVGVPDMSLGTQTPTMLELASDDWTAKWEELCMQIIYGEKPVDAFDDMLAEYKEAGFDKVTEEMNEWYSEFK